MIKIHASKKLYKTLSLNEEGYLSTSKSNLHSIPNDSSSVATAESVLGHWHANVLNIQAANCILLCHDITRFPIFIPCLKTGEFPQLDWHFQDAFMNTLLKMDANQEQLDFAAKSLAPMQFDQESNRSVLGTMTQMKKDIEAMLEYDRLDIRDLSGYRVGPWLADRPCNVKGQKDTVWPGKEMLMLLSQASPQTKPQETKKPSNRSNVIQLDDFR